MESFSERLEKVMLLRCKRPIDVSVNANVNKGNMSKYLQGKVIPKQSTIIQIANYLRVSPEYLLGLSEDIDIFEKKIDTGIKDLFNEEQKPYINDILSVCMSVDLATLQTITKLVKTFEK